MKKIRKKHKWRKCSPGVMGVLETKDGFPDQWAVVGVDELLLGLGCSANEMVKRLSYDKSVGECPPGLEHCDEVFDRMKIAFEGTPGTTVAIFIGSNGEECIGVSIRGETLYRYITAGQLEKIKSKGQEVEDERNTTAWRCLACDVPSRVIDFNGKWLVSGGEQVFLSLTCPNKKCGREFRFVAVDELLNSRWQLYVTKKEELK
jgi:hypothetical protein